MTRPSSYKPEYAEQAEKLCRLGATDLEVADFLGISDRTLYRWRNEYEAFCQALKVGKAFPDDRVESSLYQRAVGYAYTEQQAFKVKTKGGGEDVKVVEVERHQPGDTTAAIFWLKNRRPDLWRDIAPRRMDNETEDQLVDRIRSLDEQIARLVGGTGGNSATIGKETRH